MAREQSIEFFSGNDITLLVSILDADTGEALDITSASALEWQLAKAAKNPAIVSKDLDGGVTVVDGPAGRANVVIDAADTEAIKGEFYHEMRMTNAAGKKSTVFYGTVTILENLVRD